ncbi:MAG: hypothetical protein V1702_01425 [Candidatus Woesearchaeota archaeon]
MYAEAVRYRVTERRLQVVKLIATLNYSRPDFSIYASERLGLSRGTVTGHMGEATHARTGLLCVDISSLVVCWVSEGVLSLDKLVAGRKTELKRTFAELKPYEQAILQEIYRCALEKGTVCNKILAPQLKIEMEDLRDKITLLYRKLRPHYVTNRPQLATVSCYHEKCLKGNGK